jgi:hypothetical protein
MAVSLRFQLFGALSAAILASACGDDDNKTTPTPDAGAVVADAGGGGSPGALLAPNTAGKMCENSLGCGGQTCSEQLTGGEATSMLAGLATLAGIRFEAGGGPIPAGYCTASCTSNAQCGVGGVCFGGAAGSPGECRKSCTATSECGAGQECATQGTALNGLLGGGRDGGVAQVLLPSTCQGLPTADKLVDQVGRACTAQNAAQVCGDGICTAGACTGVCASNADCGTDGLCRPIGVYGSQGLCVETCNVDTDCARFSAGGIGCNDVAGVKTCGAKQFPLAAGVVGKACTPATEAVDCGATGDCAEQVGLPPVSAPGGYCSLSPCDNDSMCGGGSCVGTTAASRCYAKCASDTECRTGYSCQERALISGSQGKICAPIAPVRDGGTLPVVRDAGTSVDAGGDAGL